MDSRDVNDACKSPISLQKHLYLICQANLFLDPKLYFATPNGVKTPSLRSPGLQYRNCLRTQEKNLCKFLLSKSDKYQQNKDILSRTVREA